MNQATVLGIILLVLLYGARVYTSKDNWSAQSADDMVKELELASVECKIDNDSDKCLENLNELDKSMSIQD
jgi:hypothetical protein